MSGILAALAGIKTAIATAVDEYFNRVTLLLNTSSTNGAQNNTFLDSSTNNFTITRNGNTTQGTFTPFSQTGWSNYFNGDASCDLQTPSDAAFGYGTGDFCLEAFVYQQTNANARIIDHTDDNFNFGVQSNGVVQLSSGGTSYATSSSQFSLNTWTHICATRQGSTLRIFVNGVLRYNTTFTNSKGTSAVNIGSNPGGGGETLNGYISNLRIVKGGVPSAYSTSSTTNGTTVFTPSTTALTTSESLTAGSFSLLTCQSNRFRDASSNAFAISVTAGTPSVQAFSPFLPTAAYDTAVVGGSGYFDGTGDYLATSGANAALGAGTFTIDGWFYSTGYNGGEAIYSGLNTYPSSTGLLFYINGSGTYTVDVNGSNVISAGTAPLNAWTHFALVRSSTGAGGLALYINGVSIATGTTANNFTSTDAVIGRTGASAASNLWLGYLFGIRIVVGSANVPSGVPTAPPTAITNTTLLLNYTNAGIYDSSAKSSWETVGNVQVSTAQAKWGTTSIYFPGSSTNQRLLPSQNYPIDVFGTGDFTLECWLYVISQGATAVSGLWDQRPGANGAYINWVVDFGAYGQGSSSNPKLVLYTNASVLYASGVLSMGAWNHVALCRANGTTRMFINGTLSGTAVSDTNNYLGGGSAGNYRPSIGSTDGGDSLYGYMDDFRATRYARYTADFTPPTAAFGTQ